MATPACWTPLPLPHSANFSRVVSVVRGGFFTSLELAWKFFNIQIGGLCIGLGLGNFYYMVHTIYRPPLDFGLLFCGSGHADGH